MHTRHRSRTTNHRRIDRYRSRTSPIYIRRKSRNSRHRRICKERRNKLPSHNRHRWNTVDSSLEGIYPSRYAKRNRHRCCRHFEGPICIRPSCRYPTRNRRRVCSPSESPICKLPRHCKFSIFRRRRHRACRTVRIRLGRRRLRTGTMRIRCEPLFEVPRCPKSAHTPRKVSVPPTSRTTSTSRQRSAASPETTRHARFDARGPAKGHGRRLYFFDAAAVSAQRSMGPVKSTTPTPESTKRMHAANSQRRRELRGETGLSWLKGRIFLAS